VPEVDPKLVVFSCLSPQDGYIMVDVSRSRPFFGAYSEDELDESLKIDIATVVVRSSEDTVIVPWDDSREVYYLPEGSLPIIPGETYFLEVSAPGYPSVDASTTVPYYTPTVSYTEYLGAQSFTGGEFGESSVSYEYNVQWLDQEPGDSYYRVILGWIEGGVAGEMADELYTDVLNDGETLSKNVVLSMYSGSEEIDYPYGIYLLNTDENYYRYHLTTQNYNGGGDPFSEPVMIYSNITNGLGCFCSYNGTYQIFD
jgi:hypothetical protein